jgi:hypothetical protein
MRTRSRWNVLPGLIGLLFAANGCVQYVPLGAEPPAPGDEVRIYLSPEGQARFQAPSGGPLRSFEGRTVAVLPQGDSLQVMVPWGPVVDGTGQVGRRYVVTLHPSEVLATDRKTISRSRSALVGVGIAGVVGALFRSVAREKGNQGGAGEEPVPPPVDF